MKKEPYRDYATAAIMAWSEAGCPSEAESRKRFHGAEREDMQACALAFAGLRLRNPEICTCALLVYLPGKLGKGELTNRVVRYSMEHFISERRVWEYLASARREFALQRGLRVG